MIEKPNGSTSAGDLIMKFYEGLGGARDFGGKTEEMLACTRIVQTLVQTGRLTADSLTTVFNRAHKSIPIDSTYLLAYSAIEKAFALDVFSLKLLETIEESVLSDSEPFWEGLGLQDRKNAVTMQRLMLNEHICELVGDYICSET